MRPRDTAKYAELDAALVEFCGHEYPLPGIQSKKRREAFIAQLVDSMRRVEYVSAAKVRDIHRDRANPASELFDPLKAAIVQFRSGNVDEAAWLIFLFVHFGKHARSGWRYAREVYGALGQGSNWSWTAVYANPAGFRAWLDRNEATLKRGIHRGFGNHRKYQSLDAYSDNGTGAAVQGYVDWVQAHGGHTALFNDALIANGGNPEAAFDWLYKSMSAVPSFGRTARFDYLTMIAKVGISPIAPGSAYLAGATGPLSGARLLFQRGSEANLPTKEIEKRVLALGRHLNVGMQEMEDSICNWQKSPDKYMPFRG